MLAFRPSLHFSGKMCNLYRFEPGNLGIDFTAHPNTGNLAPAYVGADQDGPVLHRTGDGLELKTMRWGFPPTSPKDSKGRWAQPITNIRNLESNWWRGVNREWMLKPEFRCLVPFSSFAEPVPGGGRQNAWFEVTEGQGFFAGVWRPWSGDTRLIEVDGKTRRQRAAAELELYAFLTTEPNSVVKPIHPKAMPVILTEAEELEEWMAGGEESLRLQRPLRDDALRLREGEA